MKAHPRIRQAAKWGGLAACVLLTVSLPAAFWADWSFKRVASTTNPYRFQHREIALQHGRVIVLAIDHTVQDPGNPPVPPLAYRDTEPDSPGGPAPQELENYQRRLEAYNKEINRNVSTVMAWRGFLRGEELARFQNSPHASAYHRDNWYVVVPPWLTRVTLTAGLLIALGVAYRNWRAPVKNACASCGYPRTGLAPTVPCPECGSPPP